MNKENQSFNQLVHYIDHDLLEVLTEDQRDTIYALSASSIALKERHDTLEERSNTAVSALNREGMDFGSPDPEPTCWTLIYDNAIPIAMVSVVIIIVTASFIL